MRKAHTKRAMTISAYKKILDRMPQGVFVFDHKLRVQFTNAAFRRSFGETPKQKNPLRVALNCKENGDCGNNAACAFCAFYRTMQAAILEGMEKSETFFDLDRDGKTVNAKQSCGVYGR